MRTELRNVKELAERLERAETDARQVRGQLHEAIRQAHGAGVTLSELGKVLGVSRQRVAQIIRGE